MTNYVPGKNGFLESPNPIQFQMMDSIRAEHPYATLEMQTCRIDVDGDGRLE